MQCDIACDKKDIASVKNPDASVPHRDDVRDQRKFTQNG